MDKMTIVSIDPSLRFTALYCCEYNKGNLVYKDDLLIETEKTKIKSVRAVSDTIERSRIIKNKTDEFIKKYDANIIFAETPTGSQSANGMKSYGVVCMLIASILPTPIELTPREVKKTTVGKENASKTEMIRWSYNLEPEANWILSNSKNSMSIQNKDGKYLTNKNEHLADAIAIANTGINSSEFNKLLSLYS